MTQTRSIKEEGDFSFADLVRALFLGILVFALIPLGISWGLGKVHRVASLVALAISYLLVTFILFLVRVTEEKVLKAKWFKGDIDEEIGYSLAAMVALLILFGALSGAIHSVFDNQFINVGSLDLQTTDWIMFALDNASEAIFFDIPGIYDLHLAKISPNTIVTKTLVLVFRLSIDFLRVFSARVYEKL